MYRYALAAVMLFAPMGVQADQPDSAVLDRQVFDVLKELHNRGADLNNSGDPVGCYRMYQGGLIALRPLLGHRPDAQKAIDDALKNSEARPLGERARMLHATIAQVRTLLKPATTGSTPKGTADATPLPPPTPLPAEPTPSKPAPAVPPLPVPSFPGPAASEAKSLSAPAPLLNMPTLWDRLGGQSKIERCVDDFTTLCVNDPKIDLTRGGKYKLDEEALSAMKRKTVGFISSLSDGTVAYTGRPVNQIHQSMNLSAEELSAAKAHLKKALANQGAAEADVNELLTKVEAAFRPGAAGTPK